MFLTIILWFFPKFFLSEILTFLLGKFNAARTLMNNTQRERAIELLNKLKVLKSFLKTFEQLGEYFSQIFIDKFF